MNKPQVKKVLNKFALMLREYFPIFLAGCSPAIRGNLNKILVKFKHQLCLFQSCPVICRNLWRTVIYIVPGSLPCLHLPLAELHDVGDHSDGLVDAVREEPEGGHAQFAHELLKIVWFLESVGAKKDLVSLGDFQTGHVAILGKVLIKLLKATKFKVAEIFSPLL